ncbi:MAG: hypothetical protein Kow0069_29580 [Promethearchaeota archaeon]
MEGREGARGLKEAAKALAGISRESAGPKEFTENLLSLFLEKQYPKIAKAYEHLRGAKELRDSAGDGEILGGKRWSGRF